METLTPKKIVSELDKFVIGQNLAKKAVAIALRNRWRRQQIDPDMRDEIAPKNIIMIGPTGVGKTEIARRLSKLAKAPFLKIEASKFTEVGYVGRDVESMIRDLTHLAINMVKSEAREKVQKKAEYFAEERLLDILLPPSPKPKESERENQTLPPAMEEEEKVDDVVPKVSTREKIREKLRKGKFEDRSQKEKDEGKRCPQDYSSGRDAKVNRYG